MSPVYWNGSGTPPTCSGSGTLMEWTDDAWFERSWVRDDGEITLYVRDTEGTVESSETTPNTDPIGESGEGIACFIGAASAGSLGHISWIDGVVIQTFAEHPVAGIDGCPALEGAQSEDSDGVFVGEDCDACPDVIDPRQEYVDVDGIGDACDGCEDHDGDGYGEGSDCESDCDDTDGAVSPDAEEVVGIRIDNDCDPLTLDALQDTGNPKAREDGGAPVNKDEASAFLASGRWRSPSATGYPTHWHC